MKKKNIKVAAAIFAMALSVVGTSLTTPVSVYAGNGPSLQKEVNSDSYCAYIKFYETEEDGSYKYDENGNMVVKSAFMENETVDEMGDAAVYDRESNTLTLNNYNGKNSRLVVNAMGDDFKINVKGECEIGTMLVWGWYWGGSVSFEGDGTLTLNKDKVYGSSIYVYPEGCNVKVNFGHDVKVNLYGDEYLVVMTDVGEMDLESAFNFENKDSGKEVDIIKERVVNRIAPSISYGYNAESVYSLSDYIVSNPDDPDGNYSAYINGDESEDDTRVYVYKYIQSEATGAFFQDPNFSVEEFTVDEFEASKYSYVMNDGERTRYSGINAVDLSAVDYRFYTDEEGNLYGFSINYMGPYVSYSIARLAQVPETNSFLYKIVESDSYWRSDVEDNSLPESELLSTLTPFFLEQEKFNIKMLGEELLYNEELTTYTEGWQKDAKGWWYQNADGSFLKNQWKKIDGKWYHFGSNGYMQTGWYKEGSTYYYLKSNGVLASDEWVENDKYYIDANGKWVEGKTKEDVTSGTWKKDAKGWWYQSADGSYPKNQWKKIDGKWYRFDANGYMQTGWYKEGSTYYYLKSNGVLASDEWVENDKYYIDANGKWVEGKTKDNVTSGTWKKDSKGWWYQNADGSYPKNQWKKIGQKWYRFDANGYIKTGWYKEGNVYYYLKSDGSMACDEWVDNGKYYIDANGHWVEDAVAEEN